MVSEKQKAILTKNGYTLDAVNKMSYQEVSKVIGEILAKGRNETPVVQGVVTEVYKSTPKVQEKFEAHLSIEQVRTNALNVALALTNIPKDDRVLLDVADKIVNWILTGVAND